MGYIRVSDALLRVMNESGCGALDVKVYLYLCYRRQTHRRDTFEASLANLASDFGLFVQQGPRAGKPDAPRMARSLAALERLGLIERKRKKTKAAGQAA